MIRIIFSSFEEGMLEFMYIVVVRFIFSKGIEVELSQKGAVIAVSEVFG